MQKLDSNTWIIVLAVLIFVAGAILMAVSGDSLSAVSHCCF